MACAEGECRKNWSFFEVGGVHSCDFVLQLRWPHLVKKKNADDEQDEQEEEEDVDEEQKKCAARRTAVDEAELGWLCERAISSLCSFVPSVVFGRVVYEQAHDGLVRSAPAVCGYGVLEQTKAWQKWTDFCVLTPFGVLFSLLSLLILKRVEQNEEKEYASLRYHILEVMTDVVNGLASLLLSLHLDKSEVFNGCLVMIDDKHDLIRSTITFPVFMLNQIALCLLARDRLSVVKKTFEYVAEKRPYRKAFRLFIAFFIPLIFGYVTIVVAEQIISRMRDTDVADKEFGQKTATTVSLIMEIFRGFITAILFVDQVRSTVAIRREMNKWAEEQVEEFEMEAPNSENEETEAYIADVRRQVKDHLLLLIGTLGLNLVCVTLMLLYIFFNTILRLLRLSRFFHWQIRSLFGLYEPMRRAVDFLEPVVLIFADVNGSVGVVCHILFVPAFRKASGQMIAVQLALVKRLVCCWRANAQVQPAKQCPAQTNDH